MPVSCNFRQAILAPWGFAGSSSHTISCPAWRSPQALSPLSVSGPVLIDLSSRPGAQARGSLGTGFSSGLPGLPLQAQRGSAFSNQAQCSTVERRPWAQRGRDVSGTHSNGKASLFSFLPLLGHVHKGGLRLSLTAERWPAMGLSVPSASSW